jgi:SAM-dependent methyltransferase
MSAGGLDRIYAARFSAVDEVKREAVWHEVCRFLQRYIPTDASVIDVACGRGNFIRNIRAREKLAADVRDVSAHLPPDVRFLRTDGLALGEVLGDSRLDVAFMSNYLEHLPSGEAVAKQFGVVSAILKPRGRIIVLQPNIRLVGNAYWDFIDHRVALTEHSLLEAAHLTGFRTWLFMGKQSLYVGEES